MVKPLDSFRVKFVLEDGRFVYPTDKGRVHVAPRDQLATQLPTMIRDMAYTADLGMFGPAAMFERAGKPFVRIRDAVFEDAESPIDTTAFVLGGKHPS